MVLDMSKALDKKEPPVKTEEVSNKGFSFNVTPQEFEDIKTSLASDKDFETFVSVTRGARINKILLDLENMQE